MCILKENRRHVDVIRSTNLTYSSVTGNKTSVNLIEAR